MRLLTAALLSLMLTACGQSGALYFAKPEKQETARQQPGADSPASSADKDSNENSDTTTGP